MQVRTNQTIEFTDVDADVISQPLMKDIGKSSTTILAREDWRASHFECITT